MATTDPTTPTGKRMLRRRRDHDDYYVEQVGDADILAIEREAAAAERERLRLALKAHQDEVPYCPAASEMYELLEEPSDE